MDESFKFLERCLATLAKENKEVYICGDFNLGLLKIDTDHFTQYFFNLLCSYGMLPLILQPTRVIENTVTVIDNIFSNNLQDAIISGNVLLTLSKHFSQFISVNREKLDLKNIIVHQRDYSNFLMRVLGMMCQSKLGTMLMKMSMQHLKTSILSLKALLSDMLH